MVVCLNDQLCQVTSVRLLFINSIYYNSSWALEFSQSENPQTTFFIQYFMYLWPVDDASPSHYGILNKKQTHQQNKFDKIIIIEMILKFCTVLVKVRFAPRKAELNIQYKNVSDYLSHYLPNGLRQDLSKIGNNRFVDLKTSKVRELLTGNKSVTHYETKI